MTSESQDRPLHSLTRSQRMKLFGMSGALLATAMLAWWSFHGSLLGIPQGTSFVPALLRIVLVPLALFTLWIAVASLLALMGRPRWLLFLAAVLSSLAPFFFFSPTVWLAAASLLLLVAVTILLFSIIGEANDRVRFSLRACLRPHLGIVLAVVAVSLSFTFYSQAVVLDEGRQGLRALDAVANLSATLANALLPSLVDDYRPEMTVDEFLLRNGMDLLRRFMGSQQEQAPPEAQELFSGDVVDALDRAVRDGTIPRDQVPPEILAKLEAKQLTVDDLVAAQEETFVRDQLDAIYEGIAQETGVHLQGTENVSDAIRRLAASLLAPTFANKEKFFSPILAAALGFLLLAFDWLYQLLVKVWGSGLFALLRRTRFFSVTRVPATKDVVTY